MILEPIAALLLVALLIVTATAIQLARELKRAQEEPSAQRAQVLRVRDHGRALHNILLEGEPAKLLLTNWVIELECGADTDARWVEQMPNGDIVMRNRLLVPGQRLYLTISVASVRPLTDDEIADFPVFPSDAD